MPSVKAERRRVVITGLGCVSPLGVDADSTWQGAIEGRSGIRTITRFDVSELPVQFAGEIPGDVNAGDIAAKELRRLDGFILYALAAAREAMEDSGLNLEGAAGDRRARRALRDGSRAILHSGGGRHNPPRPSPH